MFGGGGLFAWTGVRIFGRQGIVPAVALIGHLLGPGAALAQPESLDCATVNFGGLNVVLAPGSSAVRAVELGVGDTLDFTFLADVDAVGTLTRVDTGGERPLFRGPNGTHVLYKAEQPGAVAFRLGAEGDEIASFTATCRPAGAPGADMADGSAVTKGADLTLDMSVPLTLKSAATAVPVAGINVEWLGAQHGDAQIGASPLGVKLKLKPAILVGVMAQFEQAENARLGPRPLSEQAWLAGPVTTLQLGQGVSLDARAAWGPTMDHAADRQLIDARLAGKQALGAWRFSPSVGLSYLQETHAAAAIDQPTASSHQQTVESGRVDVRPEMAYRIDLGQSTFMEPKVMVGAFWDLGGTGAQGGVDGIAKDPRAMAETGVTFGSASGTKLQLDGAVEEGAPHADDVWRGRVQLSIPLK